jgi:hypothetical protein
MASSKQHLTKKRRLKRTPRGSAAVPASRDVEPQDPRVIEAVTVAWMLSLMASLLSEAGVVLGLIALYMAGGADQLPGMLAMIPTVLAFVAWVTGTCCLGLTFLTHRLRSTPAPASIVRTAVVAGLLPWLGLIGLWVAQTAR